MLRGNGAMFRGVIPFMPVRAMLRASPWRFMDAGADFGWTDAALQLRAGQLDARRRWPWAVELEGRTGRFSPFREPVLRQTGVVRARAELYPALGRTGEMDGFGVLTLGASTGTHFYYLFVPSRVADVNEGPIAAALMVGRVETRLEASLGVHARVPRAAFTIALQPWLTLDAARIDTWECGGCSLQFERLSAPWGFALVASGSLVFDRE